MLDFPEFSKSTSHRHFHSHSDSHSLTLIWVGFLVVVLGRRRGGGKRTPV